MDVDGGCQRFVNSECVAKYRNGVNMSHIAMYQNTVQGAIISGCEGIGSKR